MCKSGKLQHSRNMCPAKETVSQCHKMRRWARVCRNRKSVNEVTETKDNTSEHCYLNHQLFVDNCKGSQVQNLPSMEVIRHQTNDLSVTQDMRLGEVPWSCRHPLVPRSVTLPHFIHPSATVEAVSSGNKTCCWVHFSNHIEPLKGQKAAVHFCQITTDLQQISRHSTVQFIRRLLQSNIQY